MGNPAIDSARATLIFNGTHYAFGTDRNDNLIKNNEINVLKEAADVGVIYNFDGDGVLINGGVII